MFISVEEIGDGETYLVSYLAE